MILTIDIGNSVITVGTVSRAGIHFVEQISTDLRKTDLEYAVAFRTILDLYKIPSRAAERKHPLLGGPSTDPDHQPGHWQKSPGPRLWCRPRRQNRPVHPALTTPSSWAVI